MNWGRIVAIVSLMLAGVVGTYEITAHAQQQFPPPCQVSIPAEWGELKGVSEKIGMVFEDRTGTIRIIANMPCDTPGAILNRPYVQVEIRRSK